MKLLPHPIFDPLVEYHRTGGPKDLNDHLVIENNGDVVITRNYGIKSTKSFFRLTRDDLNRLESLLTRAGFKERERSYAPTHPDGIKYVVSYQGRTVQTMDGTTPLALQPVLDELNKTIERVPEMPPLNVFTRN